MSKGGSSVRLAPLLLGRLFKDGMESTESRRVLWFNFTDHGEEEDKKVCRW